MSIEAQEIVYIKLHTAYQYIYSMYAFIFLVTFAVI